MKTAFAVIGALFLILIFPAFVGIVMAYVGWRYGGFWGWVSGIAFLTPLTVYWYHRLSQQIKNYLALLQSQGTPLSWDVDKSVSDFIALLRKQRKEETKER